MGAKERQRKYREKKKNLRNERLSVWISSDAANSLREVANGLSTTQGQLLSKLLLSLSETYRNLNQSNIN